MNGKTRLELTWIGKEERPRLEPRILIEEPSKSYHAARRGKDDIFENVLIKGDNLLALKALEQKYLGRVKCIFIDPPFNTGTDFEHYQDGIEHSQWLSMMRDRLACLHRLLAADGFIFVQIDYRESARLKLVLDEIFGAGCFRNEIIVGRGTKNVQSQFEDIDALASGHDSIYLYAKSPQTRIKTLYARVGEAQPGKWDTFWRGTDRPTMRYELFGITPEKGQWRWSQSRAYAAKTAFEIYVREHANRLSLDEYWQELEAENGREPDFIRLGPDNTVNYYVGPRDYKMLSDVWLDLRTLGKITDFPHEKHEELLARIIEWVSKPGEIILDSFAGSGTTGAAAHKLGRRWIMVELGDHCDSHIIPRLRNTIDGTDSGGITDIAGWKGGGGFRYYHLAPSLIETDRWGNAIISKKYNPPMLAEAMCKHLGFTYGPSMDPREYWKHGYSSERDFIFVTTASLTAAALRGISEDVGPDNTLLVCCKAFDAKSNAFDNLTLKKIPQAVLANCEWGRDDYSLRVSQLPEREAEPEPAEGAAKPRKAKGKLADDSPSLFDKGT